MTNWKLLFTGKPREFTDQENADAGMFRTWPLGCYQSQFVTDGTLESCGQITSDCPGWLEEASYRFEDAVSDDNWDIAKKKFFEILSYEGE